VPGRVEHDPQLRRIAVRRLVWGEAATGPFDQGDGGVEVVDGDFEAFHPKTSP
jgi:hypothetical protein